jgi:DNA-binding MarR family transcriptional regulator
MVQPLWLYHTRMDGTLLALDEALIRLRRLWSAGTPRLGRAGEGVEMSTVLIVDAVQRLTESEPAVEATVALVADRLDVAASTASRLVDRAVATGMVRRTRSAADPRRAPLELTPEGRALAARATRFRLSYLTDLTSGWSERDRRRLAQLLGRFATAVHDAPHPRSRETKEIR